jgi:RHS repeat-associated protein
MGWNTLSATAQEAPTECNAPQKGILPCRELWGIGIQHCKKSYTTVPGRAVSLLRDLTEQKVLHGCLKAMRSPYYDEFGQRVFIEYGNGVKTQYKYDPKRRWLKNIETTTGQQTYQDIDYTLDRVGNVLNYTNKVAMYETSQSYEYDGLYQLIRVQGISKGRDATNTLPAYHGTYEQNYSFDAIGNMTKKVSSINNSNSDPRGLNYQLAYVYGGSPHRAIQIGNTYYEYDGNGNVVQERYGSAKPPPETGTNHQLYEEDGIYSTDYGFALRTQGPGGSTGGTNERNYTWNERNQLRQSEDRQYQVRYRYGADGQRAIKYAVSGSTHTETLYFNKMMQVGHIAVYDEEVESKHIYVGETRIVTKQRFLNTEDSYVAQEKLAQYYYHGDHLGSAQLVTDHEGKLYEHIEYTPYGELWVEHTQAGNLLPFRFTAKEYDRETGLYYYGARYLDPKTSRWISTDPAMGEYIPGAPVNDEAKQRNQNLPGMGGVFNYVNLHVYHYAGNNPIKLVDPDGRWGKDVHKDKTAEWAMQAGFTGEDAEIIGRANNNVDFFLSITNPIFGDQSWHFNTGNKPETYPTISNSGKTNDTRIIHMEEQLEIAIGLLEKGNYKGALKAFGKGLHVLQDVYAHDDKYVGRLLGRWSHWPGPGGIAKNVPANGMDADDHIDKNREGYAKTERATKLYLGIFKYWVDYYKEEAINK